MLRTAVGRFDTATVINGESAPAPVASPDFNSSS
jgi:hypothetical protein